MKVVGSPRVVVFSDDPGKIHDFTEQLKSLSVSFNFFKKLKSPLINMNDYSLILYHAGPSDDIDKFCIDKILEEYPSVPIIALTDGPSTMSRLVAKSTQGILRLPVSIENVKTKLRRYLDPKSQKFRVFDRAQVAFPISWSLDDNSVTARESQTVNISRGGVFIHEAKTYPPRGEIVRFEMIGPNHEILSGIGIVRWLSPSGDLTGVEGFGLEFLELGSKDDTLFSALQI